MHISSFFPHSYQVIVTLHRLEHNSQPVLLAHPQISTNLSTEGKKIPVNTTNGYLSDTFHIECTNVLFCSCPFLFVVIHSGKSITHKTGLHDCPYVLPTMRTNLSLPCPFLVLRNTLIIIVRYKSTREKSRFSSPVLTMYTGNRILPTCLRCPCSKSNSHPLRIKQHIHWHTESIVN